MAENTFELNQNLLRQIVSSIVQSDLNTEWTNKTPETKYSLITLRHASQVCSSWRELILSTTSWWGCVIDLNLLDQKSDKWRNEILARSGESALEIRGRVPFRDQHFLEMLFEKHLARIRVLHLISDTDILGHLDLLRYFQCPAPSMELFAIQTGRTCVEHDHKHPSIDVHLFSHSAPSLRYLRPFPLQPETFVHAPFIRHLRRLDLSQCRVNSQQLLDALQRADLLEELICIHIATPKEAGRRNSIKSRELTLPYLQQIDICASDTDEWLHILSSIIPATQCKLKTSLDHFDFSLRPQSPAGILGVCRILSFYSERSPPLLGPTCVCLSFGGKNFSLQYHYMDNHRPQPILSFSLTSTDTFPAHAISALLRSLIAFGVTNAVSLDLRIAEHCDLDPANPDFIEFTKSTLSSVSVLIADLPAIQFLLRLDMPNTTEPTMADIFPSLWALEYPYCADSPQTQLLATFISWRQRIGHPISVMNITPSPFYEDGRRDFRFLEEIIGLTVVWNIGFWPYSPEDMTQYVCGSSNPDALYFEEVDYGCDSDSGTDFVAIFESIRNRNSL